MEFQSLTVSQAVGLTIMVGAFSWIFTWTWVTKRRQSEFHDKLRRWQHGFHLDLVVKAELVLHAEEFERLCGAETERLNEKKATLEDGAVLSDGFEDETLKFHERIHTARGKLWDLVRLGGRELLEWGDIKVPWSFREILAWRKKDLVLDAFCTLLADERARVAHKPGERVRVAH